jgi:hypothetical protein
MKLKTRTPNILIWGRAGGGGGDIGELNKGARR